MFELGPMILGQFGNTKWTESLCGTSECVHSCVCDVSSAMSTCHPQTWCACLEFTVWRASAGTRFIELWLLWAAPHARHIPSGCTSLVFSSPSHCFKPFPLIEDFHWQDTCQGLQWLHSNDLLRETCILYKKKISFYSSCLPGLPIVSKHVGRIESFEGRAPAHHSLRRQWSHAPQSELRPRGVAQGDWQAWLGPCK